MKKTSILLICTLIIAFACILLVGCTKTEQVSSIDLKDYDPTTAIEMPIGRFDFSEYVVNVNYESGSVVEVALSEDMISELDRLKFYQAGDHVITVNYGKHTCEFKISVKRNTFGELKFPENNVFHYDGTEHKIELEGELPSNASISYLGGNVFVNAGVYNVTAVVTCNGYVTERISTTVTVKCAKYDMSGITLDPGEFVYDGREHIVSISGELPEGVPEPVYYINGNKTAGVVDVGEYTVTAMFPNTNPNYESIPSLQTTLKILPSEFDIGEVNLVFKNENGSELLGNWKKYDGKTVSFEIENIATIAKSASVFYTITDENGNEISRSNTKTNIREVGNYTIRIDFALLDNKNYKELESMEFTFNVNYSEYDMSKVFLNSELVEYNGKKHVILLSMPPEFDSSIFSVSYEYYRAGEDTVIQENGSNAIGVRDAGEYKVRAVFTVKDPNFKPIEPMEATLVIEKKMLSASGLDFDNTVLSYTGEALTPTLGFQTGSHLSLGKISVYKLEGTEYVPVPEAVDVGEYRAELTVSLADTANYAFDNGETSVSIACDFVIEKVVIDVSSLGFLDNGISRVKQGDPLYMEFDNADMAELSFEYILYEILDDDNPLQISEALPLIYEGSEIFYIDLISEHFVPGRYVCAVTAKTENPYYVLSSGEESETYYFDFVIEEGDMSPSRLSFLDSSTSSVTMGEAVVLSFTTRYMDVSCEYMLKSIDGQNLMAAPEYIAADEHSILHIVLDSYAFDIGSYICEVTVRLNDPDSKFSNGETTAKYSFEFAVEQPVIDVSRLGFLDSSASSGKQGEHFKLQFATSEYQGIKLHYYIYEIRDDELYEVTDKQYINYNGEDVISIEILSEWLNVAKHVCVVTVTVDDPAFALSNGAESAEYRFEFVIEEGRAQG